jgi:hypothetical protein
VRLPEGPFQPARRNRQFEGLNSFGQKFALWLT